MRPLENTSYVIIAKGALGSTIFHALTKFLSICQILLPKQFKVISSGPKRLVADYK